MRKMDTAPLQRRDPLEIREQDLWRAGNFIILWDEERSMAVFGVVSHGTKAQRHKGTK